MKMKCIKLMTLLMVAALATVTFTACGDDDEPIVRPNYTKVKYTCSLGEDFLQFYDVTVTYTDINAQEVIERMSQRNWQYEGKKDGLQPGMRCQVVAKLKSDHGDLSATSYDLSYAYTVYKYDKETSALERNEKVENVVLKENLETFLSENQTIVIFTFPE
jgi:hypothetical protein